MNRSPLLQHSFQVFSTLLLATWMSLGAHANEVNSISQSKVRRPKPTFFEQTQKGSEERRKQKGFAENFLSDALSGLSDPLGGAGGSASGTSNAGFQGQSNTVFNISPNSQSVSGTFTRINSSSGSFFDGNSTVIIGNLDQAPNPLTLNQGGLTYFSSNYGLTGDSGFAVFTVNEQTATFLVDNLGKNLTSIPVGQSFPGRAIFSNGLAPDQ